MPTTHMANLIALMVHCGRDNEVIIGDKSHIYNFEGGSISKIGNVSFRLAKNDEDGTINLNSIRDNLRRNTLFGHMTWTSLICVEDTCNGCGGVALPFS